MHFKAPWWLLSPHLQTMWPTFCRRPLKQLAIKRERFELPDGDFLDLDWLGEGKGPIVLLLHGLEGSVESPYIKGMMDAIARQGWRALLLHFRSCSGEPNRLSRLYHSGETSDVATLLTALREREPHTLFAAIGFSLGGNVLLKWLGETKEHNRLKAAVAVSVPFELGKSVDRINQGFSRFYQWYLLRSLHKKVRVKFANQRAPIPLPPLSTLHTLRDFDDKITAPLHGFLNAQDYYTRSSCRQYLHTIHVPTLVLQAKDDPFMTADLLPEPHELSPRVQFELTDKGGHVGFVGGKTPWQAHYWLEKRVPAFLKSHL